MPTSASGPRPVTAFSNSKPEERRPSLERDVELVRSINEVGYDLRHHRCKLLVRQLATYGAGTLVKLWSEERLFSACKQRGVYGFPPPPLAWPSDAPELLTEVACQAAPRFIVNSLPGWSPGGGASVATYYINYCFFEFKRVYVPYCRREHTRDRYEVLSDGQASAFADARALDDPELSAIERLTLSNVLSLAEGEQLRRILGLLAEGASRKDIAGQLDISVNTVSRRLVAYRRTLEANGWTTGSGDHR